MPTLWVLALFGIFYKFCFQVQTCHHLGGGGCVYFLKSARKRHFRNVWVGLGGDIFQHSTTHWTVHTNMALYRSSGSCQVTCTHSAPPERALLRVNGFCGASGEATARGVNLYEDMVAAR